jgi:hypothetical protein
MGNIKPPLKRSTYRRKSPQSLQSKATIMNKQDARCQCMSTCPNPPLPKQAFCAEHIKSCPRQAPLSGAEPRYEPWKWNTSKVQKTHNCFSYAFNIFDIKQLEACEKDPLCDVPFHQPGSVSGYPAFNDTDPKTCPNMIARIMGDNITVTPSAFELRCPKGSSKIALVVDEDQDYHFLRQDSNGYFSQKSGEMPVTNLDSLGHKIFDVALANHDFRHTKSTLNYDRFCGYFCVPRNRPLYAKVGGYRHTRRRQR